MAKNEIGRERLDAYFARGELDSVRVKGHDTSESGVYNHLQLLESIGLERHPVQTLKRYIICSVIECS